MFKFAIKSKKSVTVIFKSTNLKTLQSIIRLQECFYVKQKKLHTHNFSTKTRVTKNNSNIAFLYTLMLAEYIQKLKVYGEILSFLNSTSK